MSTPNKRDKVTGGTFVNTKWAGQGGRVFP